jgi:hypothetical protein
LTLPFAPQNHQNQVENDKNSFPCSSFPKFNFPTPDRGAHAERTNTIF